MEKYSATATLKNDDYCKVTGGTHKGKEGTIKDLHTSKTGHLTLTVLQANGNRFKTLGRNVQRIPAPGNE